MLGMWSYQNPGDPETNFMQATLHSGGSHLALQWWEDDGNCYFTDGEELVSLSDVSPNTITMFGDAFTYTFSGNTMTWQQGNWSRVYTRSTRTAQSMTPC